MPDTGGTPPTRPAPTAGVCRVLMIGDVIGKPGRVAVEPLLPGLRSERGHRLRHGQRREPRRRHGPDRLHRRGACSGRASTSSPRATTSGTSARSTRARARGAHPAAAQLRDRWRSGAGLGRLPRGRRHRGGGHQLPGSHVHASRSRTRSPTFDRLLEQASEPLPPVRVVDFHCELTSEKNAFGIHLDGRACAVVGTHTHVVTADERILPRGTAYQSDLGMVGPDPQRHRLRSSHGPAALHKRPAHALRGRDRARGLQLVPDRRRSGQRSRRCSRANSADRRGLTCPTT